jgi:HEAT repeat protein
LRPNYCISPYRGVAVPAKFPVLFLVCTVSIAVRADERPVDDFIIELMHEEDKDMRGLAFEQVRNELKGEAATKQIAAELSKLPPISQAGLLSALADRGDKVARPAVVTLLEKTEDATVKLAAINALGYLGETTDTNTLLALLNSQGAETFAAARNALVRLRGDGVNREIADTMNTRGSHEVTMIEILVARRALEVIDDITGLAAGDDTVVRGAAMRALSDLAGPEHLPGMLRGVLKAEQGRERDTAEKLVAIVCGKVENPSERTEALFKAINELDEADRGEMTTLLGRVGGAAAYVVLNAAVASPAPAQHRQGLRALCNWPDASIAPRLLELAKHDTHEPHRISALRAFIRVFGPFGRRPLRCRATRDAQTSSGLGDARPRARTRTRPGADDQNGRGVSVRCPLYG